MEVCFTLQTEKGNDVLKKAKSKSEQIEKKGDKVLAINPLNPNISKKKTNTNNLKKMDVANKMYIWYFNATRLILVSSLAPRKRIVLKQLPSLNKCAFLKLRFNACLRLSYVYGAPISFLQHPFVMAIDR